MSFSNSPLILYRFRVYSYADGCTHVPSAQFAFFTLLSHLKQLSIGPEVDSVVFQLFLLNLLLLVVLYNVFKMCWSIVEQNPN